jgi:hypothetical protein
MSEASKKYTFICRLLCHWVDEVPVSTSLHVCHQLWRDGVFRTCLCIPLKLREKLWTVPLVIHVSAWASFARLGATVPYHQNSMDAEHSLVTHNAFGEPSMQACTKQDDNMPYMPLVRMHLQ